MALVDGWVRRYIGRAPSAQDLANGQAIDAGTINPETLLAQILSCDEYYQKLRWRRRPPLHPGAFPGLDRPRPTARQVDYWFRRLELSPPGMEGRTDVAYAMLQRYPSALAHHGLGTGHIAPLTSLSTAMLRTTSATAIAAESAQRASRRRGRRDYAFSSYYYHGYSRCLGKERLGKELFNGLD